MSVKSKTIVWLAVFVGVVLTLSATGLRGWAAVAVVVGTSVLAVPLGVKRFRQEQALLRTIWRSLTAR